MENPSPSSAKPKSKELSVFWRIENFSLSGFTPSIKSAPFRLRCGPEAIGSRKFYIVFYPAHSIYLLGLVKLRPSKGDDANQPGGKKLPPPLKVGFSALLATGEYLKFHDKGRILKGLEAKDCRGWFKRYAYLLKNRTTHLPGDSLTFQVRLTSEEPVFEAERIFCRTWVPVKTSAFECSIDLAKRKYNISVPGLLVGLTFQTEPDSNRVVYEIVEQPRFFKIHTVACEAFLRINSGDGVFKKVFSEVEPGIPEKNAKESLPVRESLKLCFQFRKADGDRVSERFSETPFPVDGDKNGTPSPSATPPPSQVDENAPPRRNEPEARLAGDEGLNDGNDSEDPGDDADGGRAEEEEVARPDKIKVESLTSMIFESLAAYLSVENFCGVLSLAHAHSDPALTARAREFLSRNAAAVFRSERWRRFMAEKPELTGRIMHEMLLEHL